MSRLNEYVCDLCGDRKKGDDVHGIYWRGNAIDLRRPADANRHICTTCLGSIVVAAAQSEQSSKKLPGGA